MGLSILPFHMELVEIHLYKKNNLSFSFASLLIILRVIENELSGTTEVLQI